MNRLRSVAFYSVNQLSVFVAIAYGNASFLLPLLFGIMIPRIRIDVDKVNYASVVT